MNFWEEREERLRKILEPRKTTDGHAKMRRNENYALQEEKRSTSALNISRTQYGNEDWNSTYI